MQMIKGETIKLYSKLNVGTDDFGIDIYEDVEADVDNVIVGSPSSNDILSATSLTGKRIAYVLAIPKGDTNTWENSEVLIRGRRFRTIGIPTEYTEGNMPNWWKWGKQVMVEHYE